MVRYVFQRIIYAFLSLLCLITIVYLLAATFSKNPFDDLEDPAKAEFYFKQNGLDRPILERFGNYLKDIFLHADFGKIYSPKGGEAASSIPIYFFTSIKWSVLITLPALLLSAIIGLILGVLAGYKRGTWTDTLISFFVVLFVGLPSFVLAPIMILIAISSNGAIIFDFIDPSVDGWMLTLKSLGLPILTVTLSSLSGYTLLARNQIITILSSNHVLIAKSKGLDNWEIFSKHIVRNISIPILDFLLPSFVWLLSGNVLIEQFFRVPGASTVITYAFPNGEINILMFSIWFFSGLSLLSQIILDILCVAIDPRIKLAKTENVDIFTRIKYFFIRFVNSRKEKRPNLEASQKLEKTGVQNE